MNGQNKGRKYISLSKFLIEQCPMQLSEGPI